jgi:YD repeat-containing protein
MKKKFGFAAMLVMVLAFGILFTACNNDAQEITGNVVASYPKASAVAGVTAEKTTNSAYIIVKWDAADNASSYSVYAQQEGKKTQIYTGSSGQYQYTYDADGSLSTNTDVDKWSVRLTNNYSEGIKGRFGVRTTDINGYSSDIVWSTYIQ